MKNNINKGDFVVMNNKYYVANHNLGRVFRVKTEPQKVCGTLSVWLDGYTGCYAVDGLDLVRKGEEHER